MSGNSEVEQCPRCLQPTLHAYYDWKPHQLVSGECYTCGYAYTTKLYVLNKENLDELQADFLADCEMTTGKTTIPTLDEKTQQHMKEYDQKMGVEHE